MRPQPLTDYQIEKIKTLASRQACGIGVADDARPSCKLGPCSKCTRHKAANVRPYTIALEVGCAVEDVNAILGTLRRLEP